uniref:DDE Tnp4 domain-containing protein n=1 Tax=Fagus sylvatica TaxID=28930 RepID=A0A2N9F9Q5_FAGSY
MDRHLIFDIIANDSSSSSDDEVEMIIQFAIEEERLNSGGGSRPRRCRTFIRRDFLQATKRIFRDYFAEPPLYPPNMFRRRFQMSRSLFLRIKSTLEATEPYFVQRRNAAGRLGLSSFQKMTAAIRMLAYGTTADLCDEYSIYGHQPIMTLPRLLALGESRGFPRMLGSIDCMHWKWKNCPTAWQGSHNDINVLERSSVFTELAEGCAPLVNYSINGPKKSHFAKKQEEARKDVERAFGVLQSRFAIVRGPARFYHIETLKDIMTTCIILHNMIIEDERHIDEVERGDYEQLNATTLDPVSRAPTLEFMDFIQRHRQIRDRETHSQLQSDLMEHLWQLHRNS